MRILVVDDSVIYRCLLKDCISSILPDVELVSAPNGKIGLQKAILFQPDLIFLDIEMPVMNGLELLNCLKEEKINCPVILVSSLDRRTSQLAMNALNAGALDFISKPSMSCENPEDYFKEKIGPFIELILKRKRKNKGDSQPKKKEVKTTKQSSDKVEPQKT